MSKKPMALILVVITLSAGFGFLLLISTQPGTTPEISVDGGYVVNVTHTSAVVRALSPQLNVILSWNSNTRTSPFKITAENVNPDRIDIVSDTPHSITTTENNSLTLEITPTTSIANITFSTQEPENQVEFYVFGDSQGYQGGIEEIVKDSARDNPDFVFHCGDLTPFGQLNQYEDVKRALNGFHIPVYTTAGNHDTRLGGNLLYLDYFGPSTYSFDYSTAHFVVFNSSSGDVSESELRWLEADLMESTQDWKFVFTHIPVFDPRTGSNHTLLNTTTTTRLIAMFESTDTDCVFTGHIHMFNHSIINDTDYIITGGAGASLYADSDSGGFYHYVRVQVQDTSFTATPIALPQPSIERDMVVIRGHSEDVTLTLDDLMQLTTLEDTSSFQNSFGNWRGQGTYIGVKVSDLLSFVGGMDATDIVRVVSYDGYHQDFAKSNVYPNESWHSIQGEMILAFSYNGTVIPEWDEGLRIIMIPEDSSYSNDDCRLTSELGMGYHIYPSAGARWVSNVKIIEVVDG